MLSYSKKKKKKKKSLSTVTSEIKRQVNTFVLPLILIFNTWM